MNAHPFPKSGINPKRYNGARIKINGGGYIAGDIYAINIDGYYFVFQDRNGFLLT